MMARIADLDMENGAIAAGYYDNTTFHRNIKGFMIQAHTRVRVDLSNMSIPLLIDFLVGMT
jgi:cyclophilin family peptidyl-prolyl cis-trans isomerase